MAHLSENQVALSVKLRAFAAKHKLRTDWHEPDEQDVTAKVVGDHLDNAFGEIVFEKDYQTFLSKSSYALSQEFVVILRADDDELRINLATLLAIACQADV